ncbi:hypothetical protein [Roseomonas marmotae]|uniref:Uncharacterized protein n=1 Tax=Roseomonas marmotae TaxID=2768161 RepID=A0ABS3KLC9_9PROT|nr:hypothetical protein [Roseomonas marmotae]MBO1077136.1 hypothetical protein [Roseomonas marmotae]QTI82085.1 hypothetical protein IAI58_22270 [Roseomonas marmotae]
MLSLLTAELRQALRTAIQEALRETPDDAERLETLRASFIKVLETTAPPPGHGVSDLRQRAMIAAQIDAVIVEVRKAHS